MAGVTPIPFVAHQSVWRTLLLIGLALGFVALGLWLAGLIGGTDFDDDPGGRLAGLSRLSGAAPSTVAALIGWIAILFFGLCAVAGVRNLFQRGPVLRIDRDGVWHRRWSDAVIPWDQIGEPRLLTVQRQRFLSFDLVDRTRFRPTTLAARLAGANRAFGYGDVSLGTTGTDRRFDDMAAAFFRFRDAAGM